MTYETPADCSKQGNYYSMFKEDNLQIFISKKSQSFSNHTTTVIKSSSSKQKPRKLSFIFYGNLKYFLPRMSKKITSFLIAIFSSDTEMKVSFLLVWFLQIFLEQTSLNPCQKSQLLLKFFAPFS